MYWHSRYWLFWFTVVLEAFQRSAFDINLPVIVSILWNLQKKKKRNFHQTWVSVAPNAFSHEKSGLLLRKMKKVDINPSLFIKNKKKATDTSMYVCKPLQRKCQYYVGFVDTFWKPLCGQNSTQTENIKICQFSDFRTFDFWGGL